MKELRMNNIVKILSVKQFEKETLSGEISLHPVFEGRGENKKPLTFRDSDIQKISVIDEAGNTIGWVSKAVCSDIKEGIFQKNRGCFIYYEGFNTPKLDYYPRRITGTTIITNSKEIFLPNNCSLLRRGDVIVYDCPESFNLTTPEDELPF